MPKCFVTFIEIALQYRCSSVYLLAVCFQNSFSYERLWRAASESILSTFPLSEKFLISPFSLSMKYELSLHSKLVFSLMIFLFQ